MPPHPITLLDQTECLDLGQFLVERIAEFNAGATGHVDGLLLGGALRDGAGGIVAAFNGHTWGGCCVIEHLWVHEAQRGQGLGKALMQAAEAEAVRRGCEQMVLSTHSFQAPSFYERLGYEQRAVIMGQPKGHANLTYVKRLAAREGGAPPAAPASGIR